MLLLGLAYQKMLKLPIESFEVALKLLFGNNKHYKNAIGGI